MFRELEHTSWGTQKKMESAFCRIDEIRDQITGSGSSNGWLRKLGTASATSGGQLNQLVWTIGNAVTAAALPRFSYVHRRLSFLSGAVGRIVYIHRGSGGFLM